MDLDEAFRLLRGGAEGITKWNRRRAGDEFIPDLSGADLRRADLRRANLYSADLTEADLSGAHLYRTDLRRADLRRADLRRADLSGAHLIGAHLYRTDLTGADLSGADLSECHCRDTIFADVDLSGVKGLASIKHDGPSTVGVDTLLKSGGRIPEAFLRGCGVPEPLIAYLPALIHGMQPIQFYNSFISYSSADRPFVDRLYADLQAKGIRCWLDHEDLKIGDPIRGRIDEAIRLHDKLLLVISESSLASPWVEEEVEAALERERRQKETVLFPIRIDDAVMETGTAWAALIRRTRHIGEFTGWKDHDAYQTAFTRLLRDLTKAGDRAREGSGG